MRKDKKKSFCFIFHSIFPENVLKMKKQSTFVVSYIAQALWTRWKLTFSAKAGFTGASPWFGQ